MVPKLAPLQRTVTEHLQVARQGAGEQFKKTELGRTLSRRASVRMPCGSSAATLPLRRCILAACMRTCDSRLSRPCASQLSADIARQPGDPSEKEIMEMIDRIDKPPPKK